MSILRKAAIALLALASLSTAAIVPAHAGDRERSFVYGAIAGAAGAALVDTLARDRAPVRYGPRVYQEPVYEPRAHGPRVYEERVYEREYRPVVREVVRYRPRRHRSPAYRPDRYRAVSANHVAYCQGRYRSYDVRTDTYQPHYGPRQFCSSPY